MGIQIRVQGDVRFLSSKEAAPYSKERHIDAQIASMFFEQGKQIDSYETLKTQFNEVKTAFLKNEINSINHWGGIALNPVRIEFFKFETNRLHKRELYFKEGQEWKVNVLTP